MTAICADIGGTYARFAVADGNDLINPRKLAVGNFANLGEALQFYCRESGVKNQGRLLIATAAVRYDGGVWRFTNNNRWVIDERAPAPGWDISLIANDFRASAYGAVSLSGDKLKILRKGTSASDPRVLLGPGTGLGLAYMIPLKDKSWYIQETFGGHMLAATLTDEQHDILKLVKRLRGGDHIAIPENVASGSGLPVLYKAVCLQGGKTSEINSVDDLLKRKEDPFTLQTLRLFHEFLGLFAHNVVVTTHAFGGLYLDGGLIHRINDAGLFDFQTFSRFMTLNPVPVVKDRLESLPVFLVNDPYVALHGLLEMAKDAA
ncbi:MAG: glucokinase [Pseudomonadota bacterium]